MPKQAQSHQGAPREYPEKNGPRGLLLPFTQKHGAGPGACPKQGPPTGFRAL
jgi:hypothetical protein